MQSYGKIKNVMDLEPLEKKLSSFGFEVLEVNGHDVSEISRCLQTFKKTNNKPTSIICHTIKGKGIPVAENNPFWHHKSNITKEEFRELYSFFDC